MKTIALLSMLGAFAGLFAAPSAVASDGMPSFNCAKASTATETAICGRRMGAAMADRMLADLVKEVASEPGADTAGIKAAQKAFLKTRDACGADAACITDAYLARIAELQPPGRFVGRFTYDGDPDTGGLTIVEGKGGRTGLWLITTDGKFSCGFDTLDARREGEAIIIDTTDEDETCKAVFDINPGGDALDLNSECRSACGMNGYMDGGYSRVTR